MAEDTATAMVGTSTGKFTRRAARREALAKCRAMGGRDCRVVYEYENSCAIIAEPADDIPSLAAAYQNGPTVDVASQLGLAECSRINNGRQCKVIYSNCTEPVLVE